jgi:hypothetical protein
MGTDSLTQGDLGSQRRATVAGMYLVPWSEIVTMGPGARHWDTLTVDVHQMYSWLSLGTRTLGQKKKGLSFLPFGIM